VAEVTVDRMLTIAQAAEIAQVHEKTIRRAIKASRLKASRIGEAGAFRIRREWLEEFIEDAVVASPEPSGDEVTAPSTLAAPRPVRRRGQRGRIAVREGMGRT
jgi:excisionase family DNA binding protein